MRAACHAFSAESSAASSCTATCIDAFIASLAAFAVFAPLSALQQHRVAPVAKDDLVPADKIEWARGVIVVVECQHLCMAMRGVRKPGSRAVTSAVRGQLRNPATRAEAMSLILAGNGER